MSLALEAVLLCMEGNFHRYHSHSRRGPDQIPQPRLDLSSNRPEAVHRWSSSFATATACSRSSSSEIVDTIGGVFEDADAEFGFEWSEEESDSAESSRAS